MNSGTHEPRERQTGPPHARPPAQPHTCVSLVTADQPFVDVALLRGICNYGARNGCWQVVKIPHDRPVLLTEIRNLRCEGIILAGWNPKVAAKLRLTRCPLVCVLGEYPQWPLPTVLFDNRLLGRAGAEHLLGQGFQRFAFFGSSSPYSTGREQGFVERLAEAGHPCQTTGPTACSRQRPTLDHLLRRDVIKNWLRRLKRPVAVMACDDTFAALLLNTCLELGLRVPADVALLGVNNDEADCCYGPTPLSSVDLDVELIGYRAAEVLHRLMQGEKLVEQRFVVPPSGVVGRRSTDLMVFDDPDLTKAIQFIRAHACTGLMVEDVAEAALVSRKTLERRFRRHLNRSPAEEILRIRLERVRELLTTTTLPMVSIAVETRFNSISYLCKAFVRKFGVPPKTYRMQHYLRQRPLRGG